MPLTPMLLELGTGTALRSGDYTKAASRAVRDALWHNSINVAEIFNTNKENNDKCKIENKQFRCKKRITTTENDNKISQLQSEANSAALAAVQARDAINNTENFKIIWDLYFGILKKGKAKYINLKMVKKGSEFEIDKRDALNKSVGAPHRHKRAPLA